jgi:hypothetical protein
LDEILPVIFGKNFSYFKGRPVPYYKISDAEVKIKFGATRQPVPHFYCYNSFDESMPIIRPKQL